MASTSTREVARLRTELGLSDNQFIVVGAGQVQKRKGIDDFIRLAEELPHITFIWLVVSLLVV